MITAIDTNVLLDLLLFDEEHCRSSKEALFVAYQKGTLIICSIVYAELSAAFQDQEELDQFLNECHIDLENLDKDVLYKAGLKWSSYTSQRGKYVQCPICGKRNIIKCKCGKGIHWRQHIIPDFLIGTHALLNANRLLTRDRGYYSRWFPNLAIHYVNNSTSN